ncbi:Polynucleotide adenylyltransferase region [Halothece sp. PCC 7418]|uniref:CCA tRNA nucleotidyltransferase n=1 Tax=Halothece sp. (strain PCC 7418) TaxID=65093 RepID=UPI0002A07B4E|nr:CCA tRNA nucleotidyltransferase [Halothece sp. PCC 7418]AFZ43761.1 Polynucleotide adenylyltransferase region [Halothece sp. PCC 7418]
MNDRLSHLKLPFPQAWLPADACLVGGTVRDALLNRQRDPFDFDLILEDQAVELAREIANRCQAGFVVLDAERDMARIVFAEGTVDFARIEGESLEQDLHRRDFTINAIAHHLQSQTLIDPLQGKQDLEARVIKMVSPQNLRDDPLRLLRAYRQAGQLTFTIDESTRESIREIAPCLQAVAAERIQTELSYLLATSQGSFYLQQAWEDGVLSPWFPNLTQESVEKVQQIDTAKEILSQQFPSLPPTWDNNVGGESDSLQALAKLACFVSSSPEEAEAQLMALKYSRAEIRTVTNTLNLLPRLLEENIAEMTLRDQYFFFQDAGKVFPVVLLTAIAKGLSLESVQPLIERYLNSNDPVAYPQPLVTGKDLLRSLDLSPSPQIGELLTELQIAVIEGKIKTPREAIALAQSWLEQECG